MQIYLRITVDGVVRDISIKRQWEPQRWVVRVGKALGHKDDAKSHNIYLDLFREKVYEAKRRIMDSGKQVTVDSIKNALTGKKDNEKKKMILEIYQRHNEQVEQLVGREYSPVTLTRFRTSLEHTRLFIKTRYGTDDFDIRKLNYEFISEYAFWLKSARKCNHNTTMRYLTNFKKIVLLCVRNGWLERDPFIHFKMNRKEVERIALTEIELRSLEEKKFDFDRLNLVKDIFVFCCYTGLAYIDVKKLRRTKIAVGIDGEQWLFIKRQKTTSPSKVPSLPKALEIIFKYSAHPQCVNQGRVLSVLSNQKMNSYLKEIADVCGIGKNLTFHIARHTFATTVTLTNGVPIETVSKMLGHKSLKQTQHYAKILDIKTSQDMQALRNKLLSGCNDKTD